MFSEKKPQNFRKCSLQCLRKFVKKQIKKGIEKIKFND